MRRSYAILTIVLLFVGFSGYASAAGATTQVFYIQFGVETYTPITRSSIEQNPDRVGELNVANPTLNRLLNILTQARIAEARDLPFSAGRVRLKVRSPNLILYVDEDGLVEGLASVKILTKAEIRKVQQLIELERMIEPPPTAPP